MGSFVVRNAVVIKQVSPWLTQCRAQASNSAPGSKSSPATSRLCVCDTWGRHLPALRVCFLCKVWRKRIFSQGCSGDLMNTIWKKLGMYSWCPFHGSYDCDPDCREALREKPILMRRLLGFIVRAGDQCHHQ